MNENVDLKNLNILVTRPAPQANSLCHLIQKHNGHAIHFPTIAFGPPPDEPAFQQAIAVLGEQEWLIFNSPQAVFASIVAIRRQWPHFPPEIKFAAVGEGTAKALREAGHEAAFPRLEWNSEGLLALPAFQFVNGKKIAIIRGAGGREWLDRILIERGAHVLPVIAYERQLPQVEVEQIQALFVQHKIDIIVCASFEAVKNLIIMLGESGSLLKNCPLIVVSERIKKLAQDLDFRTIWVARNASDAAILEELIRSRPRLSF